MGLFQLLDTSSNPIDLEALGVRIVQVDGAGMPPVENILDTPALGDGAFFQRTAVKPRLVTVTCLVNAQSLQEMHQIRERVIDLIAPDRTMGQSPVEVRYLGPARNVALNARYDAGMDLSMAASNRYANKFALRLLAEDPYWKD